MKKLLIVFSVLLLAGCDFGKEEEITETNLNEGIDIITVGEIHTDAGCIVTIKNDDFEMEVSTNDVDVNVLGEYFITYSYLDDETSYSCIRFVKVIDDISPVVTLNEGIDTIHVGDEFIDAGVTYSDNYDLELEVLIKGSVDTSVPGRYEISYQVIDDSSNVVKIIRVVNVIE